MLHDEKITQSSSSHLKIKTAKYAEQFPLIHLINSNILKILLDETLLYLCWRNQLHWSAELSASSLPETIDYNFLKSVKIISHKYDVR